MAIILILIAFPSFKCAPREINQTRGKSSRYHGVRSGEPKSAQSANTDHQVVPSLNLTRQSYGIAATERLPQCGRPHVEGEISGENMPRMTNSKYSLSGHRRPVGPKPNMPAYDIQLAGSDSLSRDGSPKGYRRWNANYTKRFINLSRVSEGLSSLKHLIRLPWDRTAYVRIRISGDGASVVATLAKGSSRNFSSSTHSSHKNDVPAPKIVRKRISVGA